MTDWLDTLNPQQRDAVTHGDGPLLVVAGAGSGKTRTLAYRVAYLVSQGVAPERILLLTFTRRASQEMVRRAERAGADSETDMRQVWGGTFHATANRLLRIYAKPAGLPSEFTIIDQGDAADLMNVVRHEMGFSATGQRFPRKRTCLSIYSRRVNGSEALEEVLKRYFPWCSKWQKELAELFKEYVKRKQKQNVLDYDDLLLYWYYLLEDDDLAKAIGERFDHILVDEYQDTNTIQAGILQRMRLENKNLMVVGDDAQSIYSFRSATVRNMLDFPEQFANTTVVKLEQNYRSTEPILETTNCLISQAENRYTKDLWSTRKGEKKPELITCRDEAHQDEIIIERILQHYEEGIPLREQAVLFRAASHSNSLELALGRKNIPFVKYGGLRFLEAGHVKDLVNFLRILENPEDQMAWFRVLQLLEGVGPVTAAKVFEHVMAHEADPTSLVDFEASPASRQGLLGLGQLFADLRASRGSGPAAEIERIREYYHPVLQRVYENPDSRENDIEHLAQMAERYKKRSAFLSELILDPPVSTGDLAGPPGLEEDWVVLSTIHSAKGCEWDVVFLMHAADGFLPSDMSTGTPEEIEEELRLTYVAMTRPRDFLYVTWPLRYYHRKHKYGDNHSYAQVCRFLNDDVQQTMDSITSGTEDSNDEAADAEPKQDIAGKLRKMWE